MNLKFIPYFAALAALLFCAPRARTGETKKSAPAPELLGAWQKASQPDSYTRIEPERLTMLRGKRLMFAKVYAWRPGGVSVRFFGRKISLSTRIKDGSLHLAALASGKSGKESIYRKLEKVPEKLALKPLVFGKPAELGEKRVKAIAEELAKRRAEDQAVRTDRKRHKEMPKIDAANTAWLRTLVAELGWIDAKRFGAQASGAAFLLVQHSGDLALMTAALPRIEADVKAKLLPDAQPYALLYDRTQLMLGEKQRYGTQLGADAKGQPVVLPLENRAKVEEYRKEIGLFPLTRYLKSFGKNVRFLED